MTDEEKLRKVEGILDKAYTDIKNMLSTEGMSRVPEKSVNDIVERLLSEKIWSNKTKITFDTLVNGGRTKSKSLDILTAGNNRAESIISDYIEQDDIEDMVNSSTPENGTEDKPKPRRVRRKKATS